MKYVFLFWIPFYKFYRVQIIYTIFIVLNQYLRDF